MQTASRDNRGPFKESELIMASAAVCRDFGGVQPTGDRDTSIERQIGAATAVAWTEMRETRRRTGCRADLSGREGSFYPIWQRRWKILDAFRPSEAWRDTEKLRLSPAFRVRALRMPRYGRLWTLVPVAPTRLINLLSLKTASRAAPRGPFQGNRCLA
jgi:hypothetical protein